MSSSSGNRSNNNGASSSYPPPPITSSRLYIANKAKEILATRDAAGITKLITNLCYAKEADESSNLLYETFKKHFPNLLAVKLIHAYRFMTTTTAFPSSSRSCVRSYSLDLLTSLLIDLEESNVALKTEALNDIKEHLNACLAQQETSDREFKLLTRIVSRVSVDFFIESIPWDELSSFIVSLDDKKMLLMFGELPTVLDEDFLKPLLENDLGFKIVKGLLDQDCEEWCLALEAGFNLMLQLINLERKDLVWDSVYAIVSSVWEMVNVRKRDVVVRKGLLRLVRKVRGEALRFRGAEYEFVTRLALMIERVDGLGDDTKIAAKMIRDVLDRYYMGGTGLDSSGFIQSLIGTHHSA
ncbi:hypothetical protein Rs2_34205 [Raphanus sativus]|nr:uncharacterized protein LOC108816694 isoform X2 [Raphanus sativus]XP_056847211.1 uncharacterized protein LOC108816694 isoform X2 [Raphanus sativus]KAJ4884112.1 hypothetical protein Rs2_34205 [Raphanus sativus]